METYIIIILINNKFIMRPLQFKKNIIGAMELTQFSHMLFQRDETSVFI